MERYFTPVRGSSEDEVRPHKHYHPIPHQHPHDHHYHHNKYQKHGSHSHSFSSSHGKLDHHHHDNQHQPYHRHAKVAGRQHGENHNFTKRSSSSLSSSSSASSSASWTSEPSLDDETYLMHNKPQHSMSCSNISEVQRKYRDRESEDFDFDQRDPLHFQSQRQRHSLEHSSQLLPGPPHRAPKLCRGQSKSEEGLQQNKQRDCYSEGSHLMDHGPLYKTASLGQSLAFGDNVENTLGGGGIPKKAASSIQLPSKGILKNKDEGQKDSNFRKAKSMEVLSTRVQAKGMPKQTSMEAARKNFVRGKLQFSAFLDEITRQVISPSTLNSLGVTTPTPPKSPIEERKQHSAKQKQNSGPPPPKQPPIRAERPDSGKTSTDSTSRSRSHKKTHSGKHNRNHAQTQSPPPRHQQNTHSSKAESQRATSDKQQHRQYSQLLTDGTSTSPEPSQNHLSKHKGRHQSSHGPSRHFHSKQEHTVSSPPPLRAPGLESESPSSKSSTSASSEKSDRPKHIVHRRHSKPHRDSVSGVDRVQLLEQYNKELHENLLQMVACIENMEAELQCTKAELASFKEKYRRIQESNSVSQQANSLLEHKLKSTEDSLGSERKQLMQRIVDLTEQLETAQKTITSLENINIPSLIRELLKKHFDSQKPVEHFLYPQPSPGQSGRDQSDRVQELRDNQSTEGKVEERLFEWSQTGQKCSDARQQPVTAFLPWRHENDPWSVPEPPGVKGSDSQLPFSVADGLQNYKMMTDAKPQSHQVHQLGMNMEIHNVAIPTHSCVDVPPNPYNLDEMRLNRQTEGQRRGENTVSPGQNPSDFTYLTAQRMLDNFISLFPPPANDGKGTDNLGAGTEARKLPEGQ